MLESMAEISGHVNKQLTHSLASEREIAEE